MEIPRWLSEKNVPVSASNREIREGFIDKTLESLFSFVRDTLFNRQVSSKNGLMQSIDPRIKIIGVVFFIVSVSFLKNITAISMFLFISIILYFLSLIPPLMLVKRILPAMLLTFFISLPACFNFMVPGDTFMHFLSLHQNYRFGPWQIPKEIMITKQGLESAELLNIRVLTSISFAMLIPITTQPEKMIKGLSLLLPNQVSMIISMSYRYIFLLLKRAEESFMALKSRTFGKVLLSKQHTLIASRMGFLFALSYKLSRDVNMAMVARGYKKEVKYSRGFKIKKIDVAWCAFVFAFCSFMLWKFLI